MENCFIPENQKARQQVNDWLQQFKNELKIETYRKSKQYNFDFEKGEPLSNPQHSIQWSLGQQKDRPSIRRLTFSTLASLNTDEISDIPDIPRISFGISLTEYLRLSEDSQHPTD